MFRQVYSHRYFYLLVLALGLMLILFMHPFLRYPFDIYAHLIAIDEMYHGADKTTTGIQHGRLLWHELWANIFSFLHIDSSKLFLRAKIIFVFQTFFNLFAIYYFSQVILRNLFVHDDNAIFKYIALWSSLIFFTLFATTSGPYHLIWTFWYSVNYQITLGLFWYITALTIVLFIEDVSMKKRIFFTLQIIIISLFILRIHSMEFMYYMMYVSVLALVYMDKTLYLLKKYYYLVIPLLALLIYGIKHLQEESSKIFAYLDIDKMPQLYDAIIQSGSHVTRHLNRSSASINELMHVIALVAFFVLIHILWRAYSHKTVINTRIFIFVMLTSLFLLIPLYEFSSGLFSIVTRQDVIHRLYYSSSIFALLPVSLYYIFQQFRIKIQYIHLALPLILLGTAVYSKHSHNASHNYYKNIRSIGQSFDKDTYAFHLKQKEIDFIGAKLNLYEKKNLSLKKNRYYARADIAFVIKYIYQKEVYWEGRRANPDYQKHYLEDEDNISYNKVLFETAKMFPKYRPYF